MEKKSSAGDRLKKPLDRSFLKSLLKQIGNLSRTGMAAGNSGDFDTAFFHLEEALSLSRELDKKCLEAKLLNNLGLLYTMSGAWDRAMPLFDRAMEMVTRHYGTRNILYKTLQKNITYLIDPELSASL